MNKCISFIRDKIHIKFHPEAHSEPKSTRSAWAWFIGLWLLSLAGFSLFVYILKAMAIFLPL